jgi:hypothetical protein
VFHFHNPSPSKKPLKSRNKHASKGSNGENKEEKQELSSVSNLFYMSANKKGPKRNCKNHSSAEDKENIQPTSFFLKRMVKPDPVIMASSGSLKTEDKHF